ncbi:MAG: hypothetical protein A3J18_02530 [Candidatus Levybacteria bacterium RIFCSPLOWO2_02_FULL_40_18]|nr:MAG: NAD-dependent epimerase/dehydratase [Candidatus Levybacteria bacterium GW2011_GWA2_36_13]KKQ00976.1 MAG: NAD-dependent epimerase/dehydratase [Candidatus Levybacteria bacterium GW2011_GWB1_36_18]KKR17637.1 MAG: NAD-dependent epimerase/dehydratase [Candidatus Levybacteria bacterium GW2011_GWA1_39_32]KKR73693.1 MAG: NAD-dependent epimerase/dehydratase [Candidatus Levybacteria bacterium GW2011_GWC2_40_7]OGH20428.1 MAG: hypothetical protein A2695_01880 [Candidatus Levybacteria bacterium RIFC
MAGLNGKKILVTGGAGFIGSHLVLELLKNQAKVFVIDLEARPKSFFSLNKLSNKVNFKILDVRDKSKVFSYFNKFNFDYICHLAAEPIVGEGYDNPHATFETNIMGTVNILEAVRKYRVKGIVAASSDKAYGKTQKTYTEKSPLRGDHPYDVSKSSADLICQAYYKTYGISVVITRFGNVYGEGDLHFDRIIPGICKALIKNDDFKIRSNGKYVRDYIYVKDVVDGYLLLLQKINRVQGEAFNFSSAENLSVVEVIKKIEKRLGKRISYKILNIAKNEIPYQHLDDSKVRKLGWRTNYSLDSTIEQILDWYKHDFYKN